MVNGVQMITINLDKAKNIKKDALRHERYYILRELDIMFQRALEDGTDATHIVAEKKRLRDITKLVDECNTLEDVDKVECNSQLCDVKKYL